MTLRRLSGTVPFTGQYTAPGSMAHRISIYQKSARNADGSFPDDDLFIETWAAFRVLQGRELDLAQEVVQSVEVLFTVPYVEGLNQPMTVKTYDGNTYQILYIADPDGRRVEQRLYCRLVNQTEW
jgi:SPP1 family predicted phage head-tail adaptor